MKERFREDFKIFLNKDEQQDDNGRRSMISGEDSFNVYCPFSRYNPYNL